MIDFENAQVFKLKEADTDSLSGKVAPLLVDGERVIAAFKAMRDSVVFTDRRLIAINVQGMTGKKQDYTSLPYSKVQAWSVETAGSFDLDTELEMWFSGLGRVRLEFRAKSDIIGLSNMVAQYALS